MAADEAPIGRVEWVGLGVLATWTAFAIAGYATFGRHPELLAARPAAASFYARSFQLFAQSQIALSALVLLGVLAARARWRWLLAFVAVYALSLLSELAGTTWGIPFGLYSYSDALGIKWFERVPALIPVSWFLMALPSYALALRLSGSRLEVIVRGSLILLAWDLVLDPAMSFATRYWSWADSGPYYGMPWLNLLGWYVTGIALLGAFTLFRAERWLASVPLSFLAMFYAINLILPMGMSAAAGLWGAVLATVGALALLMMRLPERARDLRTATEAA